MGCGWRRIPDRESVAVGRATSKCSDRRTRAVASADTVEALAVAAWSSGSGRRALARHRVCTVMVVGPGGGSPLPRGGGLGISTPRSIARCPPVASRWGQKALQLNLVQQMTALLSHAQKHTRVCEFCFTQNKTTPTEHAVIIQG